MCAAPLKPPGWLALRSLATISTKTAASRLSPQSQLTKPQRRPSRRTNGMKSLSTDAFAALVEDYLVRLEKNTAPSTYREAKRILERDVVPAWRNRPIGSISRGDVNRIVDAIIARDADVHANRVLARVRALFNWAVERGRIPSSPIAGMKPPTKERPRDRVLNDDELRWLWRACDVIEWPFGPLVKLLLLTAQRRDEVAGMEWREVDIERCAWTMPAESRRIVARTKFNFPMQCYQF